MAQPSNNSDEINIEDPSDLSLLNLIDYLEILAKHKRMIIGLTTGLTVIAILYTLTLPNIYTASAKILPPQQQSGLLSAAMMSGALATMGGDLLGESKNAKLYSEILRIESLRDPIIERFNLKKVYKAKLLEDVYKRMDKTITVVSGKEGIITISADDTDPKRAADLANAHVDQLRKLTSSLSMTGASNSREFLAGRIEETRKELAQAENNLKSFQSKHNILDAQAQAGATMGALNQLSSQLSAQEIQLDILRRTYSESSQQVKNLRQSIASLRDQIVKYKESGSGVIPGFENVPELGQEYVDLTRKYKTVEAVYDMLIRQYEAARLNESNDVSSIQIIQRAVVPEYKSKPKRARIVEASAFIALFFSILMAFLKEYISTMSDEDKERWKGLIRIKEPKPL
jgi:tyrosine-protein kinase Etk/Wzc